LRKDKIGHPSLTMDIFCIYLICSIHAACYVSEALRFTSQGLSVASVTVFLDDDGVGISQTPNAGTFEYPADCVSERLLVDGDD
jgi:hypothetical protein